MRDFWKAKGLWLVIAIWAFAFVVVVMATAQDVTLQRRSDRIWIGASGTEINLLATGSIAFAGATTGTLTVTGLDTGETYYVTDGWRSSSADHGKVTWAVTANTLTATLATATTGTVNVMVLGVP